MPPATASAPIGSTTGSATPSASTAEPRHDAPSQSSGRGFRSPDRLHEHFAKHGAEFGGITEREYLHLAQALRDAPAGADVLEIVRPDDGIISRFDRRTGAFLAADADGTIRTFFKPNDGEAYFKRQAKRRPEP